MNLKESILSWKPLRKHLFKTVVAKKDSEIKVTDLSYINIKNMEIKDKYFASTNLNGSSFSYCTFKHVRFYYAQLINSSFYRCNFEDCSFEFSIFKYSTFKECVIQRSSFDESRIAFCIFRGSSFTENTWKKANIVDPVVRECYGVTFKGGRAFEKEIDNFHTIDVNNDITYIFVLKDGSWLNTYGYEVSKETIIKRIEAEL